MEAMIIVLLLALLGLGAAAVWLLAQRRPAENADDAHRIEQQLIRDGERLQQQLAALKSELVQSVADSRQTVLGQVNALDQRVDKRLASVQGDVTKSLTSTAETIGVIGKQLGELGQSAERILEVGRDVSSLQDILRPPKLRGGFGELLLERLLAQILPDDHFDTQYRFKSGLQVDAVIHLGNSLVPVDSKFPLETFDRMLKAESDEERAAVRREFVRAVRGHIDAVARYIQPEEGTFPFALMYIPAENVYYEVIVKEDLLDGRGNLSTYALEQRVIPVSPNSFYAYLQVIVLGLKGLRVEERAHEIIRHLEQLAGDFESIRKGFGTLGDHLKNASNRYTEIDHAFERFGSKLELPLAEDKGIALGQPTQPALPEPTEVPAQTTLPRPATVNGSDDAD